MLTHLPQSINTIEQAKQFLFDLHKNGETFHPEDDATDIEIFTTSEGLHLNKLMGDIYTLGSFDPCEYLLSLQPVW